MSDESDIQQWVAKQLQVATENLHWQALSGDASFRHYFRAAIAQQSYIVALAPPATEKNKEFVLIAHLLEQAGVAAPHVIAVDYEQGYILQKDLGDNVLRAELNPQSVDAWYASALQLLIQMLNVDKSALTQLPAYDSKALLLELSYFKTWFLEAMLQYQCTADEDAMLAEFFTELINSALEQPQVFVHRDFHSRNIMVLADKQLAAIDFQDAVCGAITYDAVSLLRDCYVVWPEQQVRQWVAEYWQQLKNLGIVNVDQAQFQTWFDLMGLQRHIKVLGIFARLSIRDNKHGYLHDLPTVMHYVLAVAKQHKASQAFEHWLTKKILPLAKQQAWGAQL